MKRLILPILHYSIGLFLSSVLLVPAYADSSSETILSATPSYAALFKNGVGLVVSETNLSGQEGVFQIAPLPDATLGSFWMHWGDGVQLENIKATQIQSEKKVAAATIAEILEANVGSELDLWIKDRKEWRAYRILDIPKRHDDPILLPRPQNVIPIPPPMERGEIVLLQDGENKEAVPLSWIESARQYKSDSVSRPEIENAVQFTAKPGKSTDARNISLTYLAKGIAWSPSYVLDISQEKNAVITAKAVVVNDLQPLEHTRLELIAGYPNIAFSETSSTFSIAPLQQILDQLRARGGRADLSFSNTAVLTQRYQYAGGLAMAEAAPAPSTPSTPVMGESAEDLYFYSINDVTLKKGERGYYLLFSDEVPYEHLYTWDIPNFINEHSMYQGQPEQEPPAQVVWHALKLTNTAQQPWTSAPAMTMKDGRILGQDTMYYTAAGADSKLKITQAVSINAEQNEYEVDRQRSAAQFYSRNYDLVTVRGELAVINFKEEAVTVEITKTLSGEAQKFDGEPKVSRLAKGLRSVNPTSQLVWKVEVKPGKDNAVKISYTYQIYVVG